MMTEAAWGTVVTTLGLVAIAWIQRNQVKQLSTMKAAVEDKLDQQTVQATVVETKVDEVAHTVNSKADKAAERIEALEGQIVALNAVLLRLATDVKAANGHAGEKPK